jgi:hypothetical protein
MLAGRSMFASEMFCTVVGVDVAMIAVLRRLAV